MSASDYANIVEALLAAAPQDPGRFESLCGEVQDWQKLIEQARAEGVAGVLWHHLANANAGVDPELKKQAGRYLAVERLGQTRLRAALDEAVQTIGAAGIRAVALKGPVLGDRIYPGVALRPSVDNDLLVTPADLDRAVGALTAIGYECESGLLARYFRENHHHLHLSRANTPPLELHFRATTGFGVIVPAEEFLSRSIPYCLTTGTRTWVLSPEDEFIYLGVHAARHLFQALVWLYDLKLFLWNYRDLDWELVWARSRSLGVVSALSLTFEVLEHRLGQSVPWREDFAPPHRMLARLAGPLLSVAARQPRESRRDRACRSLYRALLCDHPASSAWFFRHRVLRFARRRAQGYFPGVVPKAWSE